MALRGHDTSNWLVMPVRIIRFYRTIRWNRDIIHRIMLLYRLVLKLSIDVAY
jgi:hypothetical protein